MLSTKSFLLQHFACLPYFSLVLRKWLKIQLPCFDTLSEVNFLIMEKFEKLFYISECKTEITKVDWTKIIEITFYVICRHQKKSWNIFFSRTKNET